MSGTRRISLELPVDLIVRVQRQADMLRCSRRYLIETALLGMCNEFEQIDAEVGIPPCDPCANGAHGGCHARFHIGPCGCTMEVRHE